MHKKGVFHTMLTDNIVKKNVAADHKSAAEMFLMENPSLNDDSLDASFTSASSTSSTDNIDRSPDPGPSASRKPNMWNVYLKQIKGEHPDLSHKQAMQLGKTGCDERKIIPYADWKASL